MKYAKDNRAIDWFMGVRGKLRCTDYHRNWNKLMEVVDKIDKLGHGTEIMYCGAKITIAIPEKDFYKKIAYYTPKWHSGAGKDVTPTKILCVHKVITEFIKWYNNQ